MTDTTTEPEFTLELEQTADTITQRFLGHQPFILITIDEADGGGMATKVETGGGVPVGEALDVAEVLEYVAESLRANAADVAAAAVEEV